MTSKNILQNWFITGAKPTQEQFWAWMESYWHKNESIPAENISGLSQILENKADTEMLHHKANADASELTEEYILAWKKALGVGELPSNIATIDEAEKIGNTYTKEKVNELLENSGKNIANTDLQIPAGVVRTLDVTGAKFGIQGLENKKTDASFNRQLKVNERGVIAYTDEADITINIPETFKPTTSLGTVKIEVNHLYPKSIPDPPAYATEIQEFMANYKNIIFIPITSENLTLKTKDNLGLDINTISADGSFSLNAASSAFTNVNGASLERIVNLISNISLPNDKNWVLKITGSITDDLHGGRAWIGVSRSADEAITFGSASSQWSSIVPFEGSAGVSRIGFVSLIIKIGNIISVQNYQGGKSGYSITNAYPELGNYIPKIQLRLNAYMAGKMSYKILD